MPLPFQAGSVSTSQLGVDSQGNAVAVWEYYSPSDNKFFIKSAKLPFGNNEWVMTTLPSIDTEHDYDPCLTVDPAGNALLIWEHFKKGDSIISSTLPKNSQDNTWTSPIDVLPLVEGQQVQNLNLAVDNAGNAVAVWQRFEPKEEVQVATLPFGSKAWTPVVSLSEDVTINQKRPALGLSADGTCVVVYAEIVIKDKTSQDLVTSVIGTKLFTKSKMKR